MKTFSIKLLLLLLILFVANIFISTGYFRTIENQFDGDIVKRVKLPGAEDITVSLTDSFALISATKRKEYPPKEEEEGDLYYMDLKNNTFEPISLTANFSKPFDLSPLVK